MGPLRYIQYANGVGTWHDWKLQGHSLPLQSALGFEMSRIVDCNFFFYKFKKINK